MDDLVVLEKSDDYAPAQPQGGPSTPPVTTAARASAAASPSPSLSLVPDVYSTDITPALWEKLSARSRDDLIANASRIADRIHAVREAALAKQAQLEYEAAVKALKDVTKYHDINHEQMAALEAKQRKLQQELVEVSEQLTQATLETESTQQAVREAVKSVRTLEASRRR